LDISLFMLRLPQHETFVYPLKATKKCTYPLQPPPTVSVSLCVILLQSNSEEESITKYLIHNFPPHPTLPKLIGLPENSYKTPQDSNRRFKPTHLAKELETKQPK
jgi:hypothetical protein